MKIIKCLLVLSSAFLFASCIFFESQAEEGDTAKTYNFPDNAIYYQLPKDAEKIHFPSSANGKNCYIIYSNETAEDISNTLNDCTAKFSVSDTQNINRSSENISDFTVYKNAVKFNDGFYRDEIQFSAPVLNQQITARTAGTSNYYNNHTPDENNKSSFYALSVNSTSVVTRQFELKATGDHCRIWVLNNASSLFNVNDLSFNTIKNAIDSVFTKETAIFGSNQVIGGNYAITTNPNTKLDILIYDIFGDASASQSGGVFGFFRPIEFYQNSYLSNNGYATSANSNECEVIHIDSYFLKKDLDGYTSNGQNIKTHRVESTLIHEFQHLLNFCNKASNTATWYTEMLSMCAEDIFQSQINLSDDDSPKSRFDITFDKPYKGFKNWPDASNNDVYYAYANAYAFGAYLMRNYGGVDLINLIATNNSVDETSITNALQMLGYNETFDSVLKKFGMVYINTSASESYSLNRTYSHTFGGTTYNLSAIDLNDYYMSKYTSKLLIDTEVKNYLYGRLRQDNTYEGYTDNQGNYYLKGPRIFKPSYILLESIQPYGFVVYCAGQINSDNKLNIKHKSNLTMTVVIK